MKRIVLLLAALAVPGVAAAANGTGHAVTSATIAFYSGFPSSGGTLLVKAHGQSDVETSAQKVIAKADSVVITMTGKTYTFALDQAAKAKGQAEVDVKGALQASAHGKAKLAAVLQELAQAQTGQQSLVVLSRAQGSGHVVLALYHPDGGNAGMRVQNADQATVWVKGKAKTYRVTADGSGGVMSSLKLRAQGGQKTTLTSTVADLETHASLNASSSSSSSGGGRDSSSASAGLNVSVGGSN